MYALAGSYKNPFGKVNVFYNIKDREKIHIQMLKDVIIWILFDLPYPCNN